MTSRIFQLVALLLGSWIVMVLSHEIGHLVGGWLAGATLTDFDLAPWRFPHSIHHPDPNPLITLWSGPLLGVVAPMLGAAVLRRQWAHFIADFCLLANGSYLAVAWFSGQPHLDTQRLIDAGASSFSIILYCLVSIGFGYCRFRGDCIRLLRRRGGESEPVQGDCRHP